MAWLSFYGGDAMDKEQKQWKFGPILSVSASFKAF